MKINPHTFFLKFSDLELLGITNHCHQPNPSKNR